MSSLTLTHDKNFARRNEPRRVVLLVGGGTILLSSALNSLAWFVSWHRNAVLTTCRIALRRFQCVNVVHSIIHSTSSHSRMLLVCLKLMAFSLLAFVRGRLSYALRRLAKRFRRDISENFSHLTEAPLGRAITVMRSAGKRTKLGNMVAILMNSIAQQEGCSRCL